MREREREKEPVGTQISYLIKLWSMWLAQMPDRPVFDSSAAAQGKDWLIGRRTHLPDCLVRVFTLLDTRDLSQSLWHTLATLLVG